MAVVLDQRVITAPQIQSAIGASGQITLGGGTLQDAQDLAIVLRAGALPVPLKVAETREIGASLGQDSITKGLTAMAIAVGLVIVIMIGYYRFSGCSRARALALSALHARGARGLQRDAHPSGARRASCSPSASRSTPTC
jgi:preprotein translocase subunit SecD